MSPTALPPEPRDCENVGELLSWYANGTLGVADRATVDAHITYCDTCRTTLAVERRIVDSMRAPRDNVEHSPHAGWQKLAARLDAEDGSMLPDEVEVVESRAGIVTPIHAPNSAAPSKQGRVGRRRMNWPAALGAAVAVQAAAIAVLAVALVRHRQAEEALPLFHTLSSVDPTLAARGHLVRIAFDATVDEASARRVAEEAAGQILAGPSPHNVYTFVFPQGGDAAQTLDDRVSGLRRQAHVLLVEPVILAEQPHRK